MSRRELDLLAFSLYALAYKPQFCATVLCLAALAVFRASFVPRHKLRVSGTPSRRRRRGQPAGDGDAAGATQSVDQSRQSIVAVRYSSSWSSVMIDQYIFSLWIIRTCFRHSFERCLVIFSKKS